MKTYALSNNLSYLKKSVLFLSFCLILSLLVFYVFQINKIINESNSVLSSQKKVAELSRKNSDLTAGVFQGNSVKNIEVLAQNLNYQKTNKVHYIQILGSTAIAK